MVSVQMVSVQMMTAQTMTVQTTMMTVVTVQRGQQPKQHRLRAQRNYPETPSLLLQLPFEELLQQIRLPAGHHTPHNNLHASPQQLALPPRPRLALLPLPSSTLAHRVVRLLNG